VGMMEFIGEGMQCMVYRIGKSRVLKRLKDKDAVAARYREKHPGLCTREAGMLEPSALFFTSTARFAHGLVKQGVLQGPLWGNPIVLSTGEMEQDEVVPCMKAFSSGKRQLDDAVLEQFLSVNILLWEKGFIEASMSLDKYGFFGDRLVLYDFFELSTFREDWDTLFSVKWWRQTNAMFRPYRLGLTEKLDELFLTHGDFSNGEIEAPEECRHVPARLYVAYMQNIRGGLPWLDR
jgi:hypothetical protein